MKEKIIESIKQVKREQWLIGIIVGALLLVIAVPVKKEDAQDNLQKEEVQTQESSLQVEELTAFYENQLEETLSLVWGVGKVKVSITMESTGSKIIEKDAPYSTEKNVQKEETGSESSSESWRREENTVYEETENGAQIPYVISEIYPEIRGVIVVAQGGDDPVIVQQIQEAVMALFHMDAHKIKVMKMK